jgi:hypothetical protein
MAMFITIGYGDPVGYDRPDPAKRDAAHAHDARLRSNGVVMGVAASPCRSATMTPLAFVPKPGRFWAPRCPSLGSH